MKNLCLKKETLVILEDHQALGVSGASDGAVAITIVVSLGIGRIVQKIEDCCANKGNGGPDPIYVY